jgi:hypothetical protein
MELTITTACKLHTCGITYFSEINPYSFCASPLEAHMYHLSDVRNKYVVNTVKGIVLQHLLN